MPINANAMVIPLVRQNVETSDNTYSAASVVNKIFTWWFDAAVKMK